MNVLWLVLASLVPLVNCGLLTSQTNDSVTTEFLVRGYGYPFENHTVETEDGYILELHRLPCSDRSNSSTSSSRPSEVVLIMHGLGISSSDFVVLGPNSSLAMDMCDKKFDVWLGNARGNTYSKKHKKFSPDSFEFWNFSWHEISLFDLPAMINYITNVTGQNQIRYIGHSQGTTNYLVLNAVKPEWNDRFKSVHLMAPVAFINNAKNALLHLITPVAGQPNPLREVIGSSEFKPSKETALLLKALLCNDSLPEQSRILCGNSLFLSTEFNEDTVDYDFIPDIMATTPTSLSANQYLHYFQEFQSGHFRQFDYGFPRNLAKYGSNSPPDYDLKNVKGKVFLYFGKSDKFVSRTDLDRLIEGLPNSTLAGLYVVPIENFDHLAFLYAKNVGEKVYDQVLRDIASIE